MSTGIDWDPAPLSQADEKLVNIYVSIGRSVDDLPYTEEFDQLIRKMGEEDTKEAKHAVFRRLLGLRKQGRLPRLAQSST